MMNLKIEDNKECVPNAETITAIKEVEYMEAHPEIPQKTYKNAEEMFADILAEDDE